MCKGRVKKRDEIVAAIEVHFGVVLGNVAFDAVLECFKGWN